MASVIILVSLTYFFTATPRTSGWGDAFLQTEVEDALVILHKSGELSDFVKNNDAEGLITAAHLEEMGVNMFNFSFKHTMKEIRDLAGPGVLLLGNIPPRDIMASGTTEQVEDAVLKALSEIDIHDKIIWSTGGGMAPDTKDENINTFITTVRNNSRQK